MTMRNPLDDFNALLPKQSAASEEGPVYWLWVFDPDEDRVVLEHNEDKHHAEHVDHAELGRRVTHPDRVHGYAYRIRGGFRITDWEHHPVDDPHVMEKVRKALQKETHDRNSG